MGTDRDLAHSRVTHLLLYHSARFMAVFLFFCAAKFQNRIWRLVAMHACVGVAGAVCCPVWVLDDSLGESTFGRVSFWIVAFGLCCYHNERRCSNLVPGTGCSDVLCRQSWLLPYAPEWDNGYLAGYGMSWIVDDGNWALSQSERGGEPMLFNRWRASALCRRMAVVEMVGGPSYTVCRNGERREHHCLSWHIVQAC
jgi:hypothetical protein